MKSKYVDNPTIDQVEGSIRVEDKMRLRELELQTQYEVKYLSDSFKDLKKYVMENRELENSKFDQLNKKVNWLWWMVLAQLSGADIPKLIEVARGVGI